MENLDSCKAAADQELESRRQELSDALSADDAAFIQHTFDGSDPDTAQAVNDWSDCLADAGWDYASPEEVLPDLERRWTDVQGHAEDVAAFQESERRLAVDEHECAQEHLKPLEAEFIAELDRRLAAYGIEIYGEQED
jgi:hypothetical protein